MDGEVSGWVQVKSSVPQGTVVSPVLSVSFINNLPKAVKSKVRLVANDGVAYREVKSDSECAILQDDFNSLEN